MKANEDKRMQLTAVDDSHIIDENLKTIYLHGEINEYNTVTIISALNRFDTSDGAITIKIFSAGGDLVYVLALISEILRCDKHIITEISSMAFSGAAFVFLCGDIRRMSRLSSFMFHEILSGRDGTTTERKADVRFELELTKRIYTLLLEPTALRYEDVKQKIKENTDWFLTPKECLKYKIAHEIF